MKFKKLLCLILLCTVFLFAGCATIEYDRIFLEDGTSLAIGISFIKNGVFYNLDLKDIQEEFKLLICDDSQIVRLANEDEIRTFISEFDNLSEKEKNDFSEIIDSIKKHLLVNYITSIVKK